MALARLSRTAVVMCPAKGYKTWPPAFRMLTHQQLDKHAVMRTFFQAVAWLLAFAIIILSLGPPSVRPSTGAAHDLEHFLIFLAMGTSFGFGYAHRLLFLVLAQGAFAGAIEVAHIWVPGRHARMSDFLVDAAAACLGIGFSCLFLKFGLRLFKR